MTRAAPSLVSRRGQRACRNGSKHDRRRDYVNLDTELFALPASSWPEGGGARLTIRSYYPLRNYPFRRDLTLASRLSSSPPPPDSRRTCIRDNSRIKGVRLWRSCGLWACHYDFWHNALFCDDRYTAVMPRHPPSHPLAIRPTLPIQGSSILTRECGLHRRECGRTTTRQYTLARALICRRVYIRAHAKRLRVLTIHM